MKYQIPSGVIKHGVLENTLCFFGDFPIETSISSGFPATFEPEKSGSQRPGALWRTWYVKNKKAIRTAV